MMYVRVSSSFPVFHMCVSCGFVSCRTEHPHPTTRAEKEILQRKKNQALAESQQSSRRSSESQQSSRKNPYDEYDRRVVGGRGDYNLENYPEQQYNTSSHQNTNPDLASPSDTFIIDKDLGTFTDEAGDTFVVESPEYMKPTSRRAPTPYRGSVGGPTTILQQLTPSPR